MKLRLTLALWIFAGAVSAFASREKPVIGLSLDTLKEERWQRDRDTFIAEAQKLGASVIVQSANSDDTRQVRDVESLISRNVSSYRSYWSRRSKTRCSTPLRRNFSISAAQSSGSPTIRRPSRSSIVSNLPEGA